MNTSDILVVGDSYSAAREGDTGLDLGWPDVMGIDHAKRQAVSGSTAAQWAADFGGRLTQALNTPSDVLILSLLGNDAFAALAAGFNLLTAEQVEKAYVSLHAVVAQLCEGRQRSIVLLYPDPFNGRNSQYDVGLPLLNGAIRSACAVQAHAIEFVDLGEWLTPGDFNGTDMHPTRAGHQIIAQNLTAYLSKS